MIWREKGLLAVLGVHGLAALMLGGSVYLRSWVRSAKDVYQPLWTYIWILVTFLPLFGLLGAFFLFPFVKLMRLRSKGRVFEDYESFLNEEPVRKIWMDSSLQILREFRQEVGFEPFIDILNGQNDKIKAIVIRKLAETISPNAVQLLKIALKDRSGEVRLYAASALIKIEAKINEKLQVTIKRAKTQGTWTAYAELGDLYRVFAETNLSGKNLSRHYLVRSSEAYRQSLDMHTDQPDIIVQYGKCLVALGQYEKARRLAAHAAQTWPANMELVFLQNEIYFMMGEMSEIQERFRKLDKKDLDPEKAKIYDFWVDAESAV